MLGPCGPFWLSLALRRSFWHNPRPCDLFYFNLVRYGLSKLSVGQCGSFWLSVAHIS